jgi:biotin carboxylase
MPVNLRPSEIEQFRQITEKAALALSINQGVVKGDLIYTNDKEVKVFEITPRLGGPRFGTEMIPLSNGTNLLAAAIQQALGENINMEYLNPKSNKGMVNRAIFPEEGIIDSISGLDYVKVLPGYYDFKWLREEPFKKDDIIKKAENMCGGIGYIIATGETREEAILNADLIEKNIVIKTH